MDLASVILGLVICAVTAAVLYFISMKSFQEKPFEQVLAEQQQFADSLLKADKSSKDKKTTKKPVVKKNKEKAKSHNPVAFEDKPHVEFEPDAEVIPEEPQALEKKKTDKKDKVKPILRHREPVQQEAFDPDVDSINHFVENPPKDDVELKSKDKKAKGNVKPVVAAPIEEETVVVEPVAVKEVAFTVGRPNAATTTVVQQQQQQQPSTPKKQKKRNSNKNDSVEAVDGGEELLSQLGGTEKLLSALRQLPLTSSELQTMIEVLLNRQQEASGAVESEWMERGGRLDPIGALRKQLADKDKSLTEELEEKLVYQTKLRTLGTEMAAERTRAAAARKQLEESLARQTSDMQVMTSRLQQLTDQHAAEVNGLRLALQQATKASQTSDDHLRQLQRLQDDKNQLEARFASAQQEMAARVQQLEEFLMHKDQQMIEQAGQMAILAANLQESEAARSGQSHDVQRELGQLREALQASEAQSMHAAHDARLRLEEMERTKQLLEDRITKVDRDLAMERSLAAQNEERIRQEVSRLCLENQALNVQLSSTSQSRQDDDAKMAAVCEQLRLERDRALVRQTETLAEVDRLKNEVQLLTGQLDTVRHDGQSTLQAKNDELEAQKRKNNELRDKNYKAMDALAAAEKALVESKKASQAAADPSVVHRAVAGGLRRVFPELAADEAVSSSSSTVFADWVAGQLSVSLERLRDEERTKAQAQVVHYKTVLSQTEELLNRLQSRVEAEEANWRVKMMQIESDLNGVRQERDFWMEQCSSNQQQQQQQQKEKQEVDVDVVASLHSRIESLQKEKDILSQEVEKERLTGVELSSQSAVHREQLIVAESLLAEERRTVQQLRDQLDQTKAELSATKVGSIGFMVGWANKSSAATVAAATARKNSLNSENAASGVSPPSPHSAQDDESTTTITTKSMTAATNGNGTKAESPIDEQVTAKTSSQNGQKGKNRKKKGASHSAS